METELGVNRMHNLYVIADEARRLAGNDADLQYLLMSIVAQEAKREQGVRPRGW